MAPRIKKNTDNKSPHEFWFKYRSREQYEKEIFLPFIKIIDSKKRGKKDLVRRFHENHPDKIDLGENHPHRKILFYEGDYFRDIGALWPPAIAGESYCIAAFKKIDLSQAYALAIRMFRGPFDNVELSSGDKLLLNKIAIESVDEMLKFASSDLSGKKYGYSECIIMIPENEAALLKAEKYGFTPRDWGILRRHSLREH